jgi:hypothetical protein
MKSLDVNHSCIKLGVRLQKLSKRLRGNILATRNGDVRMPGTKLRLEAGGERGFLHTLVNLKQVRVRLTDTDPNNFRRAFCRKHSHANYWQKERAELDCAEFFAQRTIHFVRNVAKETERQMHLRWLGPAHAANVRIKRCKQLTR